MAAAAVDGPSFRGIGLYDTVISCLEKMSRRADTRRSAKTVKNISRGMPSHTCFMRVGDVVLKHRDFSERIRRSI